MAHPQIAAFAGSANGNTQPSRAIAGQNTLITRTIHDMAYNPIRDEFVVPQFYAQAILTYRGGANGNEAPIRIIQGSATQLKNPQRLALDAVNQEVFVPQLHRILVFSSLAEGNVAPIRILEGPDTQFDDARTLAVDPVHNLLLVAAGVSSGAKTGMRNVGQVLIFDREADGNSKPLRVIRGPNSLMRRPASALMAVYPPRGLFLLGIPSRERLSPDNFVGVWSVFDAGDVPPRWMIGGPNSTLRQVRGITLDPKNKNVIVSDKFLNAIFTFHFPEIF